MTPSVLFDDSLPQLLGEIQRLLGKEALKQTVVLRDATGRLAFFYDGELSEPQLADLDVALRTSLGAYARNDRLVADRNAPGAEHILHATPCQWLPFADQRIRYLDRRIVGADWLISPTAEEDRQTPPRFVFASMKGGVGRTTALCVAATELSRDGKRILVVDLDLEAPGVGSLLLAEAETPRLGAIDYLVESTLLDRALLDGLTQDLVAASFLTQSDTGRVDVVPAFGAATKPENYLGKLARALLDVGPGGITLPVRTRISWLIDALTAQRDYDVVLIDARAGLAELAAGPLMGLAATVFLFGTAQRQTIEDYRLLFAHMNSLIAPDTESPWQNLRFVLAKTTSNTEQNQWFCEELYTLFQEYLYEEQLGLDGFNYAQDDTNAPHFPVPIAMNPAFASWDPQHRPDQLTVGFYKSSFDRFLELLQSCLRESFST